MAGNVGYGVSLALRSGLAPLVLGMRWARGLDDHGDRQIPSLVRTWRVVSKVALDEIFLASELASATVVSLRDHGRVGLELDAAVDLFHERGWLDDPASYHQTPEAVRQVRIEDAGRGFHRYRHLQFESGYAPHPGEPGRDRWLGYESNHTGHAWMLEHPGAPRPWLVCIPGYRMGHPLVDFTGFKARWLHQHLGLNVLIPVLPLHGPRRNGRRGGDGFLTGDFLDTVHAQTQAVWDVRRLMGWLRETREATGIGAYGVSLGGYTTALLAGLEDDLDCVIAGAPATDFVRLLRRHLPPFVHRAAEAIGFPFDTIEQALRVVSPLSLPARVSHERRFVYAGLADTLVTPDHAHDLWRHWDRPTISWYEGGHVSFLWEAKVRELVYEALRGCGLVYAPASLPASLPPRPAAAAI